MDVPAGPADRLETIHDPLPAASGRLYRLLSPQRPDSPSGPFILRSPRTTVADLGTEVHLNVLAAGDGPLVYQWYFNGETLQNRATPSLVLPGVELGGQSFQLLGADRSAQ